MNKQSTFTVAVALSLLLPVFGWTQSSTIGEPPSHDASTIGEPPSHDEQAKSLLLLQQKILHTNSTQGINVPLYDNQRGKRYIQISRNFNENAETKIFALKYIPAEEMTRILSNVYPINVFAEQRTNSVILSAPDKQLKQIESLIVQLDVPGSDAAQNEQLKNVIYRIYMIETENQEEKPRTFSLTLNAQSTLESDEYFDSFGIENIDILVFNQSMQRNMQRTGSQNRGDVQIHIQGKTSNNEALKLLIQRIKEISGSPISVENLKWLDESDDLPGNISANIHEQLPENVQRNLNKFLGDSLQTVGYWFGNSSIPGKMIVPIGPWELSLTAEKSYKTELHLQVDIVADQPKVHRSSTGFVHPVISRERKKILSNTIKGQIGKPFMIGYNRESSSGRTIGALVIIPETELADQQ